MTIANKLQRIKDAFISLKNSMNNIKTDTIDENIPVEEYGNKLTELYNSCKIDDFSLFYAVNRYHTPEQIDSWKILMVNDGIIIDKFYYKTTNYNEYVNLGNLLIKKASEVFSYAWLDEMNWDPTNSNIQKFLNKLSYTPDADLSNMFKDLGMEQNFWEKVNIDLGNITCGNGMEMFRLSSGIDTLTGTLTINNASSASYLFEYAEIDNIDIDLNINGNYILNMFNGCKAYTIGNNLKFDEDKYKTMLYCFAEMPNITNLPKIVSTNADLRHMFRNSPNIILSSDSIISPKDADDMFNGCTNLVDISAVSYDFLRGFGGMYRNCVSITEILNFDYSKLYNGNFWTSALAFPTGSLGNLAALTRLTFKTPMTTPFNIYGIDIRYCSLDRTAIVEMFNSLPNAVGTTAAAKVITLTGNPGVATLTTAERNIAINKGWSLTL